MPIKKTSCNPLKAGGYSLLELLLVLTLLPVVFFAVYSNFSTGFKVWARVVRATPQEDLDIFYTKTRRDLQSMRRLSSVVFEGDREEISFAASVEARPELGGQYGLGQVRLFYDKDSRTVLREVKDYSEVYRGSPGTQSVLLKNVTSFELAYFTKGGTDSSYGWTDSWKPEADKLPLAVKMTFSVADIPGTWERTVFIPVGGVVKK